jgi:hypothetical protein
MKINLITLVTAFLRQSKLSTYPQKRTKGTITILQRRTHMISSEEASKSSSETSVQSDERFECCGRYLLASNYDRDVHDLFYFRR